MAHLNSLTAFLTRTSTRSAPTLAIVGIVASLLGMTTSASLPSTPGALAPAASLSPVIAAPPANLRFDASQLGKLAVGDPIPTLFNQYGARNLRLVSREAQGDGEVLRFEDPVRGMLLRATFFICEGRLTGAVYLPEDNHYCFLSDGPGRSWVEFVPHSQWSCGTDELTLPEPGPQSDGGVAGGCTDGVGAQVWIDVLITYNSATLARFPSVQSLNDSCQLMIANSNGYYNPVGAVEKSGMYLRMVGLHQMANFQLGSVSILEDITRLQAVDGYGDEIQGVRDAVGADLVCFLRPEGEVSADGITTGIAFLSASGYSLHESLGYSVVASTYMTGATFGHEIGHNGGCNHDAANADAGYIPLYAYGVQFTSTCAPYVGTKWHSVMGYNNFGYVNLWPSMSSPTSVVGCVPGGNTNSANNMRRLSETKSHTAGFRCHVLGRSCGDPIVLSLGANAIETHPDSFTPPITNACLAGMSTAIHQPRYYSYTAASGGPCVIDTCGTASTWDTKIAVYRSCGTVFVACNDDSPCSGSSVASRVEFAAEYGVTYIVVVGSYDSPVDGTGTLNVNLSPPAGWGNNGDGQCNTPLGLGVVTDIAAGKAHTVAIKSNGTVATWGANNDGQSTVPAGLGVVTRIAAGDYHTVALKVNGSVAAWGNNGNGQCNVPVGIGIVTQIAAGGSHTVAVKANGSVAAWGNNGNGQCTVPINLGVATDIAAGYAHTVALKADGTIAAWGNNSDGQCTIPAGLGVVTQIAAGSFHTVAVKATGAVAAWGDNDDGQCTVPPGLGVVTHIDAGYYHTVAAKATGSVAAWGDNGSGQCNAPAGLGFVTRVAAGGYHTVVMWTALPDECVDAATAELGMNSIDTSLLTPSANPPEDGACVELDWGNSKDGWFVYNAPSSGLLSADFCASSYDTSVVVYQGSCGALVRVGCDDDSCGSSFRSRIIDLPVESGPVYIRIGGWKALDGIANFDLSFELNCATDLDGNGSTGASDLATLLSTWGNAGAADFDHNGNVGASDLAILLGAWGACP